ncbi:glycosyltransferase family 2 protein, partial [Streptomyces sp. TRM76130]|nr:glycosyltransferase family 2 protein [Streptomyces sp. TRM76130]
MFGAARARRETEREIQEFLGIGPVQVAELDLGDGGDDGEGASLRPGPGSPPVTPGQVFVLVRRAGRPVGTLVGRVPEGADAVSVLAGLAQDLAT